MSTAFLERVCLTSASALSSCLLKRWKVRSVAFAGGQLLPYGEITHPTETECRGQHVVRPTSCVKTLSITSDKAQLLDIKHIQRLFVE